MLYFILNLLKYMKYISLIGQYLSDVPEARIQILAEKSRPSTSPNHQACRKIRPLSSFNFRKRAIKVL